MNGPVNEEYIPFRVKLLEDAMKDMQLSLREMNKAQQELLLEFRQEKVWARTKIGLIAGGASIATATPVTILAILFGGAS